MKSIKFRFSNMTGLKANGYRRECWCCHNTVNIPDSGHCPICGAVN